MKTKSLILVGVLIIALALIPLPVAADTTGEAHLTGDYGSTAAISVNNATVAFATFTPGNRNISSAVRASGNTFAVLNVTSNDVTWHVTAEDKTNTGHMLAGAVPLTHALNVDYAKNVYTLPSAITAIDDVTLTGDAQPFVHGSGVLGSTDYPESIPLDFGQQIENTDTAGDYAIDILLTYTAS